MKNSLLKNVPAAFARLMKFSFPALVFIFILEISARLDDKITYDAPFFGYYSSRILRSFDREGIKHNVPGSHFEKWKINQFGFRGREITLIKPSGTKRIVCMGTSETFGLYESEDKEWPSQLGQILDKFGNLEVINASVVGLPLKKYGRYIEKYVLRLEPDLVILSVNPFGYGVGEDKFSRRQTVPNKNSNLKRGQSLLESRGFHLRVLPKIKETVKKVVSPEILRWYQLHNIKKQLHAIEATRLKGREPRDEVPHERLTAFREDLSQVVGFLQHREIDVVLCTYPVLITEENVNAHPEIFLDHRRFYVELSISGIIDASRKFNVLIKSVAAEHHTGFVDISAAIPKTTEYFADNVHYTDKGAKLLALSIANYIRYSWLHL